MKKIILLSLFFTYKAWATCPNLTGVYFDAEDNLERTITQSDCLETVWKDETGTSVLIADGIERVLQQEKEMIAYATVFFKDNELAVNIRMDWGKYKDWDLPARWETSYFIDNKNNLIEKIIPYSKEGEAGGTEYITFRRIE